MFPVKQRWKNAGLWTSLFGLVPISLEAMGISVLPEQWSAAKDAFYAVVSLLVVLGIFNNPTTIWRGYSDDTTEKEEK